MTREEQIIEVSIEYTMQNSPFCIGGDNFYEQARQLNRSKSFEDGAQWADDNPKSPWINVNDDLPCNHDELMDPSWHDETIVVLTVCNDNYSLNWMEMDRDGKWVWDSGDKITHWMRLPELPEE